VQGDFAPRSSAGTVAAIVVGVEAVALAVAAIAYVALGLAGDDAGRAFTFALAAMAALAAAVLFLLARGLWLARRWAVSPAITWQVLQGFAGAVVPSHLEVTLVAVPLAIIGLVALVVVLRGSGRQNLNGNGAAVDDGDAA
jgi:hypothetical protein